MITKLAQYDGNQGLTADHALVQAKAKKLSILTNPEIDARLTSDIYKQEKEMYPCWTSTHIKYKAGATTALVWNEGDKKKTTIHLPVSDGWYKVNNKFGIPNGEPSSESDSEARRLWRHQNQDFDGLVARYYGSLFDDCRRNVVCDLDQSYRYGVLCNSVGKRKEENEEVNYMNNEVEIIGRIPDMAAIGTGLTYVLGGVASVAAAMTTVLPELNKITEATSCAGDCTFTKIILSLLVVAGGAGGMALAVYGAYLIGNAIFGINTIRAKIRKME